MGLPKRSENNWIGQGFICLLALCALFLLLELAAVAQQPPAAPPPNESQPAPPAPPQAAPPPSGEGGPESVHIVVGHSLLIHTPSRVKRILTGNPTVIESVVTSPAELVITAKTAGSSSLMLWDESGRSRYLDVYADLDIGTLRASIDQSFPYATVDVQSEGERVILVGTVPNKDVADQMQKMAGNFSKERRRWVAPCASAARKASDVEGALRRGRPTEDVAIWH